MQKRTPAVQAGVGAQNGFADHLLGVQVLEICFIEVRLRVSFELPVLPAPPVPLEPEVGDVVPLISTLCPTCSVSLEVSPLTCQVLPELSVIV